MQAAPKTKREANPSSRRHFFPAPRRTSPAQSLSPVAKLNGAMGNSALVAALQRSSGHPIDPAARTKLESQLGHDFSNVRLHMDRRAAEAAASVKAKAFTAGSDIFFGGAHSSTTTHEGRALLAHEL